MTGQPSDDELLGRLAEQLTTGPEQAAQDKATERTARAVAKAAERAEPK